MDGKPLDKWKLSIQPNALVSVFTTVAKSSLLISVASCIGQLKWSYFGRPRALNKMQAFDEASRGPWGTAVFLWETRGTALLPALGAIVTILLLAFEPFAQQVIDIDTRISRTPLRNETAAISVAVSWPDQNAVRSRPNTSVVDSVAFPLRPAVLGAVLLEPPVESLNIFCPKLQCQYPDFETLAVCSRCENELVRDFVELSCIYEITSDDVKINLRGGLGSVEAYRSWFQDHKERLIQAKEVAITLTCKEWLKTAFGLSLESLTYNKGKLVSGSLAGDLRTQAAFFGGVYGQFFNSTTITVSVYTATALSPGKIYGDSYMSFCHIYNQEESRQHIPMNFLNVTGSPRKRRQLLVFPENGVLATTVLTSSCFTSTTKLSQFLYLKDLDRLPWITGKTTRCRLDFCAKTYAGFVQEGRNGTTEPRIFPLRADFKSNVSRRSDAAENAMTKLVIENDSSKAFRIGNVSTQGLGTVIKTAMQTVEFAEYLHEPHVVATYNSNWTNLFERIALDTSRLIQTATNPSATNITGKAFDMEAFVQVRWAWLILPAALVLFSVLLLLLTIIDSWRTPELFKNSILAVLFHGLEDDVSPTPSNDLVTLSRTLKVALREGNNGTLKLKKE